MSIHSSQSDATPVALKRTPSEPRTISIRLPRFSAEIFILLLLITFAGIQTVELFALKQGVTASAASVIVAPPAGSATPGSGQLPGMVGSC